MRYITLEETFRQNGYRYECRGFNWLELGYDDRAKRSFEKARKFYSLADDFKITNPILQTLMNIIGNNISRQILNG